MDHKFDVIVIGGGAIGVCSAYYLSQKGLKVAVVEKGEIGMACSWGNAGLISPSHVVPLAAPGMIAKGLKWMFDPESPFYIHPRFDLELLSWLWKFRGACSAARMRAGMPVLRDLTQMSQALFHEIAATEKINFSLQKRGLIMLHRSPQGERDHQHEAALAHGVGVEARMVSRDELQSLEPNADFLATGGLYFPHDGHLIPDHFVQRLAELIKSRGVTLFSDTVVFGMETKEGRVQSLRTTEGSLAADQFVLAAGSWSPEVVRELGICLPVQAGKGYSVTIDRPEKNFSVPFIGSESRIAITPMGNQLRFAGTLELSGLDLTINPRRVNAILRAVGLYLKDIDMNKADRTKDWAGLRPCSPDGLPFIGRFAAVPNLIAATGHAMLGITLSPVTGKLVSEIVLDQKSSLELKPLSPDRF